MTSRATLGQVARCSSEGRFVKAAAIASALQSASRDNVNGPCRCRDDYHLSMAFQTSRDDAPIPVEEAQARVLTEVVPLGIEQVPLIEAAGRILREDLFAPSDMPPADNSAMDGYAVRAADIVTATAEAPVELRVIDDVPAGRPAEGSVEAGTAMRIMTGGWVPAGADAVVQVELTEASERGVAIQQAVRTGTNIRRKGEDVRSGALLVASGTRIGPAELATLAACGRTQVPVSQRPVVAIISTGDELVEPGEPAPPGTIVNSNAHLLAALVREAGGIPRMLGIVADSREATIAAFERAMESDFVLSSGGVSVGAYDFVKEALHAVGAETRFWRVAMKPGKPFLLARRGAALCFGLPGNPVSCFVTFHLFVGPALRKALGEHGPLIPASVRIRIDSPLRPAPGRRIYYRVRVFVRGGELVAEPLTSQSSGALTSMLGANGLAIVEADGSPASDGRVPVILLGPPVQSTFFTSVSQ
jgi:molybdopterin molybdotransferase